MTERRTVTLLQLAVAASWAVVPVLLGVLLVVAYARDADTVRPGRDAERHVSVRHVAALKTFEVGIVRRDRVSGPPPAADVLLRQVPACRREWEGRQGWLQRVRTVLARRADVEVPPAERIALELAEIDAGLRRFGSGDNRRVVEAVGLDGPRWLDAVATALETPVEADEYPGHRFRVQCSDVALAVSALARDNARLLPSLAWRGTEVDRVVARWRSDQVVEISARQVARGNPWTGLPGCIYLAGGPEDSVPPHVLPGRVQDDGVCSRDEMLGKADAGARAPTFRLAGEPTPDLPVDDPRWSVPPSLAAMLQPLDTLRRPAGALYRAVTEPADEHDPQGKGEGSFGPNRIALRGVPVDVGFSIDLTIDARLQALAQRTAACYTGRQDVCRALGLQRKEDAARAIGDRMLEHAMVRMAAIAIVDVASGRIEALAGAMSPCTREEYDGPGRSSQCDSRLPYPIRFRPDALLNPATFHDAMPASTIKPIMAAAFLSDANVGARWLASERAEMARSPRAVPSANSLRGQLMRSDSGAFLDRAFCGDRNFGACDRMWQIQAMAGAIGWNGGCAQPRIDCGRRDLLFGVGPEVAGGDLRALSLEVPYGRLLAEPLEGRVAAPFRLRPPTPLDLGRVRRCAAGPDGTRHSKDDWEKCSGGVVVDVVAEGWGQGHARASAVGSAGMMAMVAAAANGQAEVRAPHLVRALRGAGNADRALLGSAALRAGIEDARPNPIAREAAEVILSGLSFGHRAGTSRLACEQVFDAKTCAGMDWIAGKTGTPTFPNDDRSLDELKRLCVPGAPLTPSERLACGPLRPYKWYVAAYRTERDDPRWTKVIAVLTERNWIAATGRIHGAGDHGPNPAAEIAMQVAGRHAGALAWSAP